MTRYIAVFLALLAFQFQPISISGASFSASHDTTVIAGKKYKAGLLKRIFLGTHYRKEWITPVRVSKLDIDTVAGGLKPVKQGGSRQTTNLRLINSEGKQFVIRSVDKTPSRALPEDLKNTIAGDLIQDQISAENPYGALTIPPMANAAGLYHANPRLVFIPYDSSFGEFAPVFANMLAYLEERPDEDMSHASHFGNSKNVIGSEKLFEKLTEDPDNKVDEKFLARNRLFDMLIGDWGRHEEQWRWASFDKEKGKLYRPIARDRDHVYFKFDGIIPHLGSRKWSLRQFCNFDYKFRNIVGLNTSATSLDRSLLNGMTREQWINIAEELQKVMTDSVIEYSIHRMPDNIFALHGNEIIRKLKSRRDRLPYAAGKYYKELAREVDVSGSEKSEYFRIKRYEDGRTEVLMVKNKNRSDTLYHRMFSPKETREIRIIGLGGSDEFHIEGKARKGILLRVIGGDGEDRFTDSSYVKGWRKKNIVYDTEKGSTFLQSRETKDLRSDGPLDSINYYQRKEYSYGFTAPIPSLEYNPDDGIFLGIGVIRKTYGFRRRPYASFQRAGIHYATQTSALSFFYTGDFKRIRGKWNLNLNLRVVGPRYALNYFGFGNETVQKDTAIQFYRVKASQVLFSPLVYRSLNKQIQIGFGPRYQYFHLQRTEGRFISMPEARIDSASFDRKNYLGVRIYMRYSTIDNTLNPKKGIRWNIEAGEYNRLEKRQQYINLSSDISFFYTFRMLIPVTLAVRAGGATNFGDFEFFQANTLGGTSNLRGYRRSRFYGRSSFFQNNELRFKIADVNLYLFPGKIGLLGFYDYGRVWADGEESNRIHTGYGPGLWLQVYNRSVITVTYGFSEDTAFLNINMGLTF